MEDWNFYYKRGASWLIEKGILAISSLPSPARRLLGFWLRSLKAATTEEGKGQTRSWLIKAPLPAGGG
jgi:hypothetical protein